MKRGYVKVWRKIHDDDMLKNHKFCAFFLWALTKASHRQIDIIVGNQSVRLEPGQFIFGRRMAAKELGMTEREVRTITALAKKAKFVTIKTTNKFSIITIINWSTYQGDDEGERPAKRPASDQQATTNKNEKNEKNPLGEISPQIFVLEERYPDRGAIEQAFRAIASTRKLNRIADSVKLRILQGWNKYPADRVMAGIKTYLEKGYADQGKDEKYLLGIIRNSDGSPPEAQGETMRSTGSYLLDSYYREQGVRII